MYDVVIIGGGVVGCAIARELSRYHLRAALLERSIDVSEGTSKANSAIVHSGHSARPGAAADAAPPRAAERYGAAAVGRRAV